MALCYEPEPYNPLTEFVIRRSLSNMQFIGFQVYWILKSCMVWKLYHQKFRLIIEQIVMTCGTARAKLNHLNKVNIYCRDLAIKMTTDTKKAKRNEFLKQNMDMKKTKNPANIALPPPVEIFSSDVLVSS